MEKLDILIRNGRVIDPGQNLDEIRDIGIIGNRIAAVENRCAEYTVDASGCLVLPGLIDNHAHVFSGGSGHGIAPDLLIAHGVTTVNDGGTAGAANFESFYRSVIVNSRIRIFAGLNLYAAGQPGFGISEDFSPEKQPAESIRRLVDEYPETIRSLKIRLGEEITGPDGYPMLEAAVNLADEVRLPLVVHASNPSCEVSALVNLLRPGDVFCHCFHGKGRTILGSDGKILPAVWEARKRGVIFDCCNGRSNFSFPVAKSALEQGFLPDVISTDLIPDYFNRNGFAKSLPYLMSKYLTLGMPLHSIVRAVTSMPAALLGENEIGTLSIGSLADVSIFRLTDGEADYTDNFGNHLAGPALLRPEMTILNGDIVYSQIDF